MAKKANVCKLCKAKGLVSDDSDYEFSFDEKINLSYLGNRITPTYAREHPGTGNSQISPHVKPHVRQMRAKDKHGSAFIARNCTSKEAIVLYSNPKFGLCASSTDEYFRSVRRNQEGPSETYTMHSNDNDVTWESSFSVSEDSPEESSKWFSETAMNGSFEMMRDRLSLISEKLNVSSLNPSSTSIKDKVPSVEEILMSPSLYSGLQNSEKDRSTYEFTMKFAQLISDKIIEPLVIKVQNLFEKNRREHMSLMRDLESIIDKLDKKFELAKHAKIKNMEAAKKKINKKYN